MADLPEDIRPARTAAREYADTLLRFPNVVGCGVGYRSVGGEDTDEWSLVAFVTRKLPKSMLRADEIVPTHVETLEGTVRTDVIEVPEPRLFVDNAQYRPVIGGSRITTVAGGGTLGGNLYDSTDLQPVMLTCNHCLTVAGQRTVVPDDDRVYQPDNSAPLAGRTKRIVPMFPAPLGANWAFDAPVDAGIVAPGAAIGVSFNVIDLGRHPFVILPAYPGLEVEKRGATTERTRGGVRHIDVAIVIPDANGQRLRIGGTANVFSVRRIGSNFALPGDSGALVIDADGGAARGMVFGGDTTVSGWTYACDLDAIFGELRLQTACHGSIDSLIRRAVLRRRPHEWSLSVASGTGLLPELVKNVERFRRTYLPAEAETEGSLLGNLRLLVGEIAQTLHDDDDFAGLVDEAIGDWLIQPTIYDMLEYRLPDEFATRVMRAVEHLQERVPDAANLAALEPALEGSQGVKMRDLLANIGAARE
jgi:hypothetical protein